jgi:transcription-repair coupling factor (superfamily II helicase)
VFADQNQEKYSIQNLQKRLADGHQSITCLGVAGAESAYLAARLHQGLGRPLCWVVADGREAEKRIRDLDFFGVHPPLDSLYFPPYNILPYKFIAYHNQTAAARIQTLYRLLDASRPPLLVTTIAALLQRLIPKRELVAFCELLLTGEEIDRDALIAKLLAGGYSRSTLVEEPGDFCVRGGIIDLFSPLYPDPLRIEFFGDTVEVIRFFSAESQRTLQSIPEAVVVPARETILKTSDAETFVNRVRKLAATENIAVSRTRKVVERIKTEGVFPGIESLLPLLYPGLDTLFDYLPPRALFLLEEPAALEKAAREAESQTRANFDAAAAEGRLCVPPESLCLNWSEVRSRLQTAQPLILKPIAVETGAGFEGPKPLPMAFRVTDNAGLEIQLKESMPSGNLFRPVADWLRAQQQAGHTALVVCSTAAQAGRIQSLLQAYGLNLEVTAGMPDIRSGRAAAWICLGEVSNGFVWASEHLAILTENEVFHTRRRQTRQKPGAARARVLSFEELKQGDLVVHDEHGIGQYDGLVKLQLEGVTNDFILIRYRDDDRLYLPVERMGLVQKYMGVDGVAPVLDKMGGKSWDKVKQRVKKSVEKIAGDLLKLYAARKVEGGYSFRPGDARFSQFEAGFPYEETPDQRQAIEDLLRDMASPAPMDRLICGDVGYGKTEVALRGAFVAVMEGKQVAVLVPTTVLAEQHFATFSQRFARYPIHLACLSRFRAPREQRQIVQDLAAGKIDIVIGTHRLLQKDVAFKDLGLIILDEEHRFGVKHKEKLKKIRKTVDVLAMTATPIPRTLHLSLTGIRDISVISTPPEDRRSIITYISEFDDAVVVEAIRKELQREGQIFFVHNNIHGIQKIAEHLKALVPEVRLDIAHGRLGEDELERVMLRFMKREIDMLVCTAIVESGLDIPAANTILINRADRFGLSQIYQLRGRVGRSDEQAYAYLFIPNESALGRDAQKRLKVLMEHSDLGSGFQIAMSDLKIRGGGTILGANQSGHIAAVGYDMFLKLMEHAVCEMKGEPVVESLEPEINMPMSAFLPEDYILDIDQRLSAYRRLARMTDLKGISDFKAELEDRYGPLPEAGANLLLKIMLKVLAARAGVKRLDLQGQQLQLFFSEIHQKTPYGIVEFVMARQKSCEYTPDQVLKVRLTKGSANSLLVQTKNILKEISARVNP